MSVLHCNPGNTHPYGETCAEETCITDGKHASLYYSDICAGKHASLGICACAGNMIPRETRIPMTPVLMGDRNFHYSTFGSAMQKIVKPSPE